MLDGIISALHSEQELDVEAVQRLSVVTGWEQKQIVGRLLSPPNPILGSRRLLRSYRDFVMWNPADDLCDRFTVVVRAASSWRCAVKVLPSDD